MRPGPTEDRNVRDALVQLGLPAPVIDEATAQTYPVWVAIALNFGMLLLMLAGFAIGASFWQPLERLTVENARHHAESTGALLYDSNFGLSLVLGIFAWICVVGTLAGYAGVATRRLTATTFVYAMISSTKGARLALQLKQWAARKIAAGALKEPDPHLYLRQAAAGWAPYFAWPALILTALCLFGVTRDVQAHRLYTREAFINQPYLPWGDRTPKPWPDVESVELGCNHITGKNASDDIVYKINFRDGENARMENGTPLNGSWLDQAEIIDARLQAAGVKFKRWAWMDREPLHPECMEAQRAQLGEADYARLLRLLRVGTLTPAK